MEEFRNACLMLTSACTEKCIYCFRIMTEKSLKLESLEEIAEKLKEMGVRKITVTGGEPTLYSDIEKVLSFLKRKGFILSITTNAVEFRPEVMDYVDFFTLSVDSTDPKILSLLGRSPHIIKNAMLYLELGERLQKKFKINTVITSINSSEENVKRLAGFIMQYSCVARWKLMKFMPIRQVRRKDELLVNGETFFNLVKTAQEMIRRSGKKVVVNYTTEEDPYLTVTPDGRFVYSKEGQDVEIFRVGGNGEKRGNNQEVDGKGGRRKGKAKKNNKRLN